MLKYNNKNIPQAYQKHKNIDMGCKTSNLAPYAK